MMIINIFLIRKEDVMIKNNEKQSLWHKNENTFKSHRNSIKNSLKYVIIEEIQLKEIDYVKNNCD